MKDTVDTACCFSLSWFSEKSSRRKENQDNFYIGGRWNPSALPSVQGRIRVCGPAFAAVFDGMGGETDGAMASLTAAECMDALPLPQVLTPELLRDYYRAFLNRLDERRESVFDTCGTTCAGVLLAGDRAQVFWLGDSRGYLLRDGRLTLLTRDHSEGQRAVDGGRMTQEEARSSRLWHTLYTYMGDPDGIIPMACPITLQSGDRLLLCSDGITDLMEDRELETLLSRSSPLERLRTKALREARDNSTAILVEYGAYREEKNIRRISRWLRSKLKEET